MGEREWLWCCSVCLYHRPKMIWGWVNIGITMSVSVQVFRKVHMISVLSVRNLQTCLQSITSAHWLDTGQVQRVERGLLPCSSLLSIMRFMLWMWCCCPSLFRKFFKPLSISALPGCRPVVMSCCACQSVCPFISSLAWPVCLFVAYRPSNKLVYLRDGSSQTILHAATLR